MKTKIFTITILIVAGLSIIPNTTEAFAVCGPLPANHEAKDKIVTTYRDGRIGVECPQLKIEAPSDIKTLVDIAGVDGGQGWGSGTRDLPLQGQYSVRVTRNKNNKELTLTGCTSDIKYGEKKTCTIAEVYKSVQVDVQDGIQDIKHKEKPETQEYKSVQVAGGPAPTPKSNDAQIEILQAQVVELQKILKQLLELLIQKLQTQI